MTLLMQKIDFRFLKDSIYSTTRRWEKLKKADSGLKVRWVSQLKRRARLLSYPCAARCVPLVSVCKLSSKPLSPILVIMCI